MSITRFRLRGTALIVLGCCLLDACSNREVMPVAAPAQASVKPVIYQMFTRLFGNKKTVNRPWGSAELNGVGKFADINEAALAGIAELGVTHIWYTGVLHHAMVADYRAYGISDDDPDVVKGRAGSPYAIKDYYNVDPDLATDPARRLDEFRDLIRRTHAHGMKVIIDIVPNHVARHYRSVAPPHGTSDLGASDDTRVEYARDNNFYYIPGQRFEPPAPPPGFAVLGGEPHPLADGRFDEMPAKWTGNGSRRSRPEFDDWYETVKLNFGVRPDGSHDFPELPAAYAKLDHAAHVQFWSGKEVPDTWQKFREITDFWLDQGVDGFRYDMAEMVPVAFWSYLNSHIKQRSPDALLIAEVYDPQQYRNYLRLGHMDVLYDKVDFYDTLKAVMQGKRRAAELLEKQAALLDIAPQLLHFLENHDEQRIASPEFAGDASFGKPAMLVSATISAAPTLLYFGQEVGETGALGCGFGQPSRTTIFDYCGVPAHQRWMNSGRFDGGALNEDERRLREFYRRLLNLSRSAPAMGGQYLALDSGHDQVLAFARWTDSQRLLIVADFRQPGAGSLSLRLTLPRDLLRSWSLAAGEHRFQELLESQPDIVFVIDPGSAHVELPLLPLSSRIYQLEP